MDVDVITDPEIITGYLTDASNLQGHAEALVRPRSTEQVAQVVAHCQGQRIPLTITAGRTSTTGAAVPHGGWLLSTEQMQRIVEIGHDRATVEPGINLAAFQREVEATGRFYPPDPTSRGDCTLGASIACNASGARSFRYGATRAWIEAAEVVLPSGEVLHVNRGDAIPEAWPAPRWSPPPVKSSAGYEAKDLLDLFIGQEGTLGVITQATVRLIERPQSFGLLAFFPDRTQAVQFVQNARDQARQNPSGPLSPRCLEYLDDGCVQLMRSSVGDVPVDAGAALFCEQEVGAQHDEEAHLEAWIEALTEANAFVDDVWLATDSSGPCPAA